MTKEEIGEIFRNLRKSVVMTQQQVADALGRSQQVVGHWETGYSQPDLNTLIQLCNLYRVSFDDAFGIRHNEDESENIKNLHVQQEIFSQLKNIQSDVQHLKNMYDELKNSR